MFGGAFLDQKICRGCDHTYDREESFLSLSLPVNSRKLEESLKEFVKGDLLEGDNAYFCEKCGEKRDTLKRMCIKTLPPVLVVHLKRFDYDWEANRAIKYDDYFEVSKLLLTIVICSKSLLTIVILYSILLKYLTYSPVSMVT